MISRASGTNSFAEKVSSGNHSDVLDVGVDAEEGLYLRLRSTQHAETRSRFPFRGGSSVRRRAKHSRESASRFFTTRRDLSIREFRTAVTFRANYPVPSLFSIPPRCGSAADSLERHLRVHHAGDNDGPEEHVLRHHLLASELEVCRNTNCRIEANIIFGPNRFFESNINKSSNVSQ